MVTILSGALIFLAALVLSVGGLALVYRFVPVPLLQAHYGDTGAIYAALYVMFGISLGFCPLPRVATVRGGEADGRSGGGRPTTTLLAGRKLSRSPKEQRPIARRLLRSGEVQEE